MKENINKRAIFGSQYIKKKLCVLLKRCKMDMSMSREPQ